MKAERTHIKGQEHVQRTHGQSQRGVGSRVGGGERWGRGEWCEKNGDNCT